MKLFDLHSDIGYSVMDKLAKNKCDILTNYHINKLRAGEFSWVCMASYFEGDEDWAYMQKMILSLKSEIAKCADVQLILDKEDLNIKNEAVQAILSVEGMCGIREQVESKIDWLYEQGIRIASLTWNDENALATGAKGNPNRGLSELGKSVLKRMEQHHMIVDVSHANEKTFWDIIEHTEAKIIATHCNARFLCDHVRNLNNEQLCAIAKRGGLVGVVSAGFFVQTERHKQDVEHLVEHIAYLKDLIGIEHIALGLDFMDDFDHHEDAMLTDLASPKDAQRMVRAMKKAGFQEAEIRLIAYENAIEFMKKHMGG